LLLVALLLVPTGGLIQAQSATNSSAYSDHPFLSGFADSEIVAVEFEVDINYRIVLGSLQRTRGQVVPEHSERLRGDLTKITYEISQEFSGEDVYQFFSEQIQQRAYTELFSCVGRACGSSNYWANDIFRNRILYGPERNQYFFALRVNLGLENDPYISLYIITRSNRRVYAYVEIIEVGGSVAPLNIIDVDKLLASLREQGSVVLPAIVFSADNQLASASDLSYIVEMLQADASLRVYLVAHLGGSEPLPVLMQRSSSRAGYLARQLIALGISSDRISAQGVGPLVPMCSAANCRDRIELVLQ